MKKLFCFPLFLYVVLLLVSSCDTILTDEDKARNLVQEWNAKNLDEAGYISNSFEDLTTAAYKGTKDVYRITHKFNYGNRGRVREYYYFMDTTFTQVLGRKRTDWDKENNQ